MAEGEANVYYQLDGEIDGPHAYDLELSLITGIIRLQRLEALASQRFSLIEETLISVRGFQFENNHSRDPRCPACSFRDNG